MPLEAVDLIDKLLQLNPLSRLGGGTGPDLDFKALKGHQFFKGLNFDRIESGLIAPPIPVEMFKNALATEQSPEKAFGKASDTQDLKEREQFGIQRRENPYGDTKFNTADATSLSVGLQGSSTVSMSSRESSKKKVMKIL